MKINAMSDLLKEFYALKKHLAPLLNDHYAKTLLNIEKVITENTKPSKKIKNKRTTKKEFYNYLFNKGA